MLSRVADLIYWTARYLERAENTARMVDVNEQLVLDLESGESPGQRLWEPLVYACGGEDLLHRLHGKSADEQQIVSFMLFDRRNPSSIVSCVSAARENARCIRDQISSEVWESLNSFYLRIKDDDYTRYAQRGSSEYLSWIKSELQLFFGVVASMVPRTQVWWFYQLGRYLERADNVSRILDVKYYMLLPNAADVGSALDMVQWASVLRSCSAFEAFRRSRRGQLTLERVLDYLVRDPHFPRSIAFSVSEARRSLAWITQGSEPHHHNTADRLLAEMEQSLEKTAIADVIVRGVHQYLDDVQVKIGHIHEAVQDTFVRYSSTSAPVLA